MLAKLLLLFIVVPLVELALLLMLAKWTDWTWAMGLVIVTGIAGTLLARSQGWRTYRTIQSELAERRLPKESLLDAVLIFLAGGFLVTPGMLTDLVGFSLLIPQTRALYRAWLIRWFRARFSLQTPGGEPFQNATGGDKIIDSYVVDSSPDNDD